MDPNKVNEIPQKYKDTVYGFIKTAQSLFPADNPYFNIVDLIMHIILLYYYHIFDSNILNDTEKETLLRLFKTNGKSIVNHPWTLIMDSKKDGLKYETFREKVHGKQNILLLIEMNEECVIGGYTKTGWDRNLQRGHTADKDAFLFHLKSYESDPWHHKEPYLVNIKQDEESVSHALGYSEFYYGIFGHFRLFFIEGEDVFINEAFKKDSEWLNTSSTYHGGLVYYEVFQIDTEEC